MTGKEWNFEAIKWMYDFGWTPEDTAKLSEGMRRVLSHPELIGRIKENTVTLLEMLPKDDVFFIVGRFAPLMIQDEQVYRKRWSDVRQMLGDDFRDVVLRHIRELKSNILHAITFANDKEWEDFMDRLFLFSLDLYMIEG